MRFPGDTLVNDPAVQTTEAVDIDATASVVWSWLVQIGQDRGERYGIEEPRNPGGMLITPACGWAIRSAWLPKAGWGYPTG